MIRVREHKLLAVDVADMLVDEVISLEERTKCCLIYIEWFTNHLQSLELRFPILQSNIAKRIRLV